jgi:hypothetical protein
MNDLSSPNSDHVASAAGAVSISTGHLRCLRENMASSAKLIARSQRCIAEAEAALRLIARIQADMLPARRKP